MGIVNNFSVLIVDDETEARLLLKALLAEIGNVTVIAEAKHSEEALYLTIEYLPDLIFLDINMPGKSGLNLTQLMKKRNLDIPVVLVSAFREYALEAIRSGVYDFLLKPVSREDLKKTVEKYKRKKDQSLTGKFIEALDSIKEETKIRINSRYSYILVEPDEIVYCSSEEGYTNIYLVNGKAEVSNSTLLQIEDILSNFHFFRLGRSLLVNLKYIRQIDKKSNTCKLLANGSSWEVNASKNAIKEILVKGFNYA